MSEVLDILKKTGAILIGDHFVLTHGKHCSVYINKDFLYTHTRETSRICEIMAERCKDFEMDMVIGPALGGIILSQWTAFHLTRLKGKEILAAYTEKTADNGQMLTRGYDALVKDKKVLVVEDLTSTGGSAQKVMDAVTLAGGNVVAVCVMVNRNPQQVTSESLGVPFVPLDVFEVEMYEADECPLCKSAVPINTKMGHGRKFLEQNGKSP